MATTTLLTIEEYAQLPVTGVRTELVDGEVIELATGVWVHDLMRDDLRVALHGQSGGVAVVEREFRTAENKVRRADVVWYAPGRITQADRWRNLSPVPDLAVEIVSPTDRAAEIRDKVHEYLKAGVTTVWVVYLEHREAEIWNKGRTAVAGAEILTADCLPGFSLAVDAVFPKGIE